MDTGARLAIFAIMENNKGVVSKLRLGRILYTNGVGLAMLIPSVSIKDRTVGGTSVEIERCLSLSWPDNSFRPQNRVAQLRPGPIL